MATTKKTTKVETPIDERETFVSLRKSFAETEQDTMEKLKNLYQLQAADNEIEKLFQLRGELPEEVKSLEDEVEAIESKCEHIKNLIEGYKQTIEMAKADIVNIDETTAKYRSQLENIANSREYDSINKEIENQILLHRIAEKRINESGIAIEERMADLDRLGERLENRKEDLAAKREELDGIVDATANQEAELVARRDTFATKLDQRTLSAYERIKNSTHNHLAVVSLYPDNGDGTYGEACGGCFHTIAPQRLIEVASGKKLVICEHCGRIIVNPEA